MGKRLKNNQPRDITFVIVGTCHICTSHKPHQCGYPVMKVNGSQKYMFRVIYERENGVIPEGLLIRHTCDVKMCINPKHLITGTHQDNANDKVERDRQAKGEGNGRAVLSDMQVYDIRFNSDKKNNSELSREYPVSRRMIQNIRQGKNWVHIKREN